MSIEAMSHVLSSRIGDATTKLVLLAYANHAAKDGTAAWPSKASVADYAERDPKTVQRSLRKLEAAGWLRRGDQELVAHLRADRRPTVYDVAMNEATRVAWAARAAAAHAGNAEEPIWVYDAASDTFTEPGDTLPPRGSDDDQAPVDNDAAREDNLPSRLDGHGGTSETPRGDTAMSPKPSRTIQIPPSPAADASGVTGDATDTTQPARPAHSCPAHPTGRPNCRMCGTTPRQLAAQAKRDAGEQARATERLRQQHQRDQAAARRADPAKARESLAAARAAAARAKEQQAESRPRKEAG